MPACDPHTNRGSGQGSPRYVANTKLPGPYLGAVDIRYLADTIESYKVYNVLSIRGGSGVIILQLQGSAPTPRSIGGDGTFTAQYTSDY